ncbi:unnamed protein product [Spirodela intermedia]|uniref:PRONE domain-containing protein n=1 Tax=Spirodela intermedia TaxID=51605 RepID=A0A7I8KQC7_SPIIN|nr:unnamed protein product [Spirodela intermedia]
MPTEKERVGHEYRPSDVGLSIIESYSRIIESLGFSILARINDVIYADDAVKRFFYFFLFSNVGHKATLSASIILFDTSSQSMIFLSIYLGKEAQNIVIE